MASEQVPGPRMVSDGHVQTELRGRLAVITLARAGALNALSLPMVRDITSCLLHWGDDERALAVLIQGAGREGKVPAFCAGGDIRFFHQAALAGDPRLEDFFTEEYALNYLIHTYAKPCIVLMDGICMGGGMGLAQGARLRVVTEHSKLAMPETNIGLFPDVGGGHFLSRCPGHLGEYLALTGEVLGAADAMAIGWADIEHPSATLSALVERLAGPHHDTAASMLESAKVGSVASGEARLPALQEQIDSHFSRPTLVAIVASLASDSSHWAQHTLAILRKRSPLMMALTLEQIRRARHLTLAEDLRMERDLVRNCFHLRPGTASETVEGIRALTIDKDHQPRWNPTHIEDVTPDMVGSYFASAWPAHVHPLRGLE
jgi:enoyl-CoA hydratase/carnithine racemase